jgi:hypothetical protein
MSLLQAAAAKIRGRRREALRWAPGCRRQRRQRKGEAGRGGGVGWHLDGMHDAPWSSSASLLALMMAKDMHVMTRAMQLLRERRLRQCE